MAVHQSQHLALVFGHGIVLGRQAEVFTGCAREVAARQIVLVAFDGHDQPAALARVLGHGMCLDGLQGCWLHVSPMKKARASGP